jgi:ribosomal-protein-alanine N-acetyltransferase
MSEVVVSKLADLGPVQKHELAQVAKLEVAAFAPPIYPVFFFRQAFDLWPELFWVARRDNQIVAYLLAAPELASPARLSLMSFAVAPQAQGQGIGKQLLTAFLQALSQRVPAVASIWLTVDPANQPALQLYQQYGFYISAQEADYYGANYERLVLTAEIQQNIIEKQ